MISQQVKQNRLYRLRWAGLAVLLFGQFVTSIDLTVLNVALPSLTADIQPTSEQQLWIVDVYSLVLAGTLMPVSSLSDRVGRKRMLLMGYALFGITSAFVLIANTPAAVIGIRAVLGLSAAMIMPVTMSLLRALFESDRERALAIALWTAIVGIGEAVGPMIGGGLLMAFSWHAAFLINVPLMAVAFIAGLSLLPEVKFDLVSKWDVPAAIIALAGMVAFMFGIKRLAAEMSLTAPDGLIPLIAGIALLVWFGHRCLHATDPLLDLRLFKSKPFTGGFVASLGAMFSMATLLFLLAQWLQLVEGLSPLQSGIALVPMGAASVIGAVAAPVLSRKIGARGAICSGLVISSVGMIAVIAFAHSLTVGVVIGCTCLVGLGIGALGIGSTVIMQEAPGEKASSAASVDEIAYDLGNVLGVAIMGSVATIVYRLGLNVPVLEAAGLDQAAITAASSTYAEAVTVARQTGVTELIAEGSVAFTNSIVTASVAGGVVLLAVTLLVARLIPRGYSIDGEGSAQAPASAENSAGPGSARSVAAR